MVTPFAQPVAQVIEACREGRPGRPRGRAAPAGGGARQTGARLRRLPTAAYPGQVVAQIGEARRQVSQEALESRCASSRRTSTDWRVASRASSKRPTSFRMQPRLLRLAESLNWKALGVALRQVAVKSTTRSRPPSLPWAAQSSGGYPGCRNPRPGHPGRPRGRAAPVGGGARQTRG